MIEYHCISTQASRKTHAMACSLRRLRQGDDLQCCQPEAPGRQRRVEGLGRLPALGVLVTEAARLSNLEPEFMVTKNDDLVGFTGIS